MDKQEQITITDNDIKAVVEIIDLFVSRGACRGEEALIVGTVRNKFATFLQSALAAREDASGSVNEEVDNLEVLD